MRLLFTLLSWTALGLTAALLSACGSAVVGAALAADDDDGDSDDPPPTVEIMRGVEPFAEIGASQSLVVEFSEPMNENDPNLRNNIVLESPVRRDLTRDELATAEFQQDPFYELEFPPGNVVRIRTRRVIFGEEDPVDVPPHAGRWYRIVVRQGTPAASGPGVAAQVSKTFKIANGTFGSPEFLGLDTVIDRTAILPNGQGLITAEFNEGIRLFSFRSLDAGGFSDLVEITNRRFAETFPTMTYGSPFRQSNPIQLVTSASGRAYKTTYDPKVGALDDLRLPVSIFMGTLEGETWASLPDRQDPDPTEQEQFGSFDGSDAGWDSFIAENSSNVGQWNPSVPVVHSWYPQVVPVGDRFTNQPTGVDADNDERAMCVWLAVPDFDRDPKRPGSNLSVLDTSGNSVPLRTMREHLQQTEIRVRTFEAMTGEWGATQTISSDTGRPYRSAPFVLEHEGDIEGSGPETLIVWYESSSPIPMVRDNGFDPGYAGGLLEGGNQYGGLQPGWWPTVRGEEDFVIVRAVNGANELQFQAPQALGLDDGNSGNFRSLVRPFRIERTGPEASRDQIVVLGLDPLHTSTSTPPPLVVQVIDLSLTSPMPPQVFPVPTTLGGTPENVTPNFSLRADWRARLRGEPVLFERVGEEQFLIVLEGVADSASNGQLFTSIFDASAMAWEPLVSITETNLGFDQINGAGIPVEEGSATLASSVTLSEFIGLAGRVNEEGNLVLLARQAFDLNDDGQVRGNYETAFGLTTVLFFDAKNRVDGQPAAAWDRSGDGMTDTAPLIDPIDQQFYLMGSPLLTAPDSAGRQFALPRVKDPFGNPDLGYSVATFAVRFNANEVPEQVGP